jgi:hypothetical protein
MDKEDKSAGFYIKAVGKPLIIYLFVAAILLFAEFAVPFMVFISPFLILLFLVIANIYAAWTTVKTGGSAVDALVVGVLFGVGSAAVSVLLMIGAAFMVEGMVHQVTGIPGGPQSEIALRIDTVLMKILQLQVLVGIIIVPAIHLSLSVLVCGLTGAIAEKKMKKTARK